MKIGDGIQIAGDNGLVDVTITYVGKNAAGAVGFSADNMWRSYRGVVKQDRFQVESSAYHGGHDHEAHMAEDYPIPLEHA